MAMITRYNEKRMTTRRTSQVSFCLEFGEMSGFADGGTEWEWCTLWKNHWEVTAPIIKKVPSQMRVIINITSMAVYTGIHWRQFNSLAAHDLCEDEDQKCSQPPNLTSCNIPGITAGSCLWCWTYFKSCDITYGELLYLRVSYGCHKILKSTSLDCSKIRSDG